MSEQRVLSVVMPCFNEIATLDLIVERVLASPFTRELVVVDDGSTDGTRERIEAFDDPRIVAMLHERNQGKGAALRTGFAKASSEYVIVQDADLEYDPADYDLMLRPFFEGNADVVYGSRFVGAAPHRVLSFWPSIGNRMLTVA